MPKAIAYDGSLSFSRKGIRQIIEAFAPDRLKLQLANLARMEPGALWPAALAVECGIAVGDKAAALSFLDEMRARGIGLPKQYVVQLAILQASGAAPSAALSTLDSMRPSESFQGAQHSLDLEACLIRATAQIDVEERWTAHVQEFFTRDGLEAPEFRDPGEGESNRFDLLTGFRSALPTSLDGPLVSVIVSCFNGERYLTAVLRSLLQQTHANLEVLVVDDCSTDHTAELVNALARSDSRIRLLRNKRNVGTYVSRNRALRAARGVYVTTQDADDWSHPERIEQQVRLLEENRQAVACYCVGVRMSEQGRFELVRPGTLLRATCYPSLMYRRVAALQMVGYWDCVRVEADAEYIERLVRLYGKRVVAACPRPLIVQLRRDGSLTTAATTANIGEVGKDRRDYRAQVGRFHRRMTRKTGRFDFENWHRPFPAPDALAVSDERVREALTWE